MAAQRAATRIDGVAAVVGGSAPGPGVDVVLRSDVELRARLALSSRGGLEVALGPLPGGLLAASLAEIVGELLIAQEARRVQVVQPRRAELDRERTRMERAAGGRNALNGLLRAMGADERELDVVARRRVLVAAFLRANLEGATVVTEAEVDRALSEHREAFEGMDDARARAAVRAGLMREALDSTIARWVSVLGARIETRLFVEYEGP